MVYLYSTIKMMHVPVNIKRSDMFQCYSYTIIRERINLCLLKLQLLKQSIKIHLGVWLIRWWCGYIY